MKRIILSFVTVFLLCTGSSCNDDYDDSALWKDIDQIYKDLNALRQQISDMREQLQAMQAIVSGSGAITSVTQNEAGNYVITYKDAENVEQRIELAARADTQPIVGMQQEGNVWYWTLTVGGTTDWLTDTDGEKIPVEGRTPTIDVDAEGYWMVFGQRITDAKGNPVRAEGKTASVITDVKIEGDKVTFTLGNGVMVTAPISDKFNVDFSVEPKTVIQDTTQPLVITYTLKGETDSSVLSIEAWSGIEKPILDLVARTITVRFPENFEEGRMTVMFYDGEDNVIIKILSFTTLIGKPTGICNVEDLKAFATAVNGGRSIAKYVIDGEVLLMDDLDLSGVDWSEYVIGGPVVPSTTTANKSVEYTLPEGAVPFNRVFNGGGHTLKNVKWTFDLSDGRIAYGLFSYLGSDAEIRQLTISGTITVSGNAPQGAAVGTFAGYAEGKITDCVSETAVTFSGDAGQNISVRIGGIVGVAHDAVLASCTNNGELTCPVKLTNTGNGTNGGFHQGGICGYIFGTSALTDCINTGNLSAPTGRSGGICAVLAAGTLTSCINRGLIQDDVNGFFGANSSPKRMGGLAGGLGADGKLLSCTNEGNVFSQLGCRTGGFVGHNEGTVKGCRNTGIILSDYTASGPHGAGWACGYNKTAENLTECIIGGKVGDYTPYKDAPETAPDATYATAVCAGKFDAALNGLNEKSEAYYDWTVSDEKELGPGVTYTHYDLTNHASDIYVLTVDLTNPKVVLETVMADELCLNPNRNNNSNNGKNLRETLSETCLRRTQEGRHIVAGVNTGFFNSDLGFPRAFHIEYDEPVYINNPYVRNTLTNHRPGFTLFTDRSISFDNRDFSGKVKAGDNEIEYYSINDTIVALSEKIPVDAKRYQAANLYTSRFKKEPHPGIFNNVSPHALFVVGRSRSDFKANCGYIEGEVVGVTDGRAGQNIEIPFVEQRNEWVLQLTGETADKFAGLKAGDPISIRADVTIGSASKSITMHNGSMYRFLNNGAWGNVNNTDEKPATVMGANAAGTLVKIVCVDGTKSDGSGMNFYQLYRVMEKLGMHNAIRFDGGGSTSMWIEDGGVVCKSCDSKGDERSCMNYMHVRITE